MSDFALRCDMRGDGTGVQCDVFLTPVRFSQRACRRKSGVFPHARNSHSRARNPLIAESGAHGVRTVWTRSDDVDKNQRVGVALRAIPIAFAMRIPFESWWVHEETPKLLRFWGLFFFSLPVEPPIPRCEYPIVSSDTH
jgi:hypothetical protein